MSGAQFTTLTGAAATPRGDSRRRFTGLVWAAVAVTIQNVAPGVAGGEECIDVLVVDPAAVSNDQRRKAMQRLQLGVGNRRARAKGADVVDPETVAITNSRSCASPMLKNHSQSYGKYTAWALSKLVELAHSAAARSDEIRNADRKHSN